MCISFNLLSGFVVVSNFCLAVVSRIINKYTRQTQSSQTSHTLALERRRRVEDLGALGKSRPSPAS